MAGKRVKQGLPAAGNCLCSCLCSGGKRAKKRILINYMARLEILFAHSEKEREKVLTKEKKMHMIRSSIKYLFNC